MTIPPIKDIVKDNYVHFVKFRQGFFYYNVNIPMKRENGTEWFATIFTFPVPLSDIGDATLLNQDKAIIFMRYIRKAIEDGTFLPL